MELSTLGDEMPKLWIGLALDKDERKKIIFHSGEIFKTREEAVNYCKNFGGADTVILKAIMSDYVLGYENLLLIGRAKD